MNEQLKFSWGHIISFLALIFISFVTFDGVVYFTDGDFKSAGIVMAVVDALLLLFFIGAQCLKATERRFASRIWFERFFVCLSPFAFAVLMLPFFHFWTVNGRSAEIVDEFTSAISASKGMFFEYEGYCAERLNNYDASLSAIIESGNAKAISAVGFSNDDKQVQKNFMLKTLRLQLLSANYTNLRDASVQWIEENDKGVSTFNVFLLGNISQIESAIKGWEMQLDSFSSKILSNEDNANALVGGPQTVKFSQFQSSHNLDNVFTKLNRLTASFTTSDTPGLFAVMLAVLLYFALLLPYFLQNRHSKSRFRLFGSSQVLADDVYVGRDEDANNDMSPFTIDEF